MGYETKGKFWRVGSPSAAGCTFATSRRSVSRRRATGGSVPEFGGPLVAGLSAQRQAGSTVEAGSRPTASTTQAGEKDVGEVAPARAAGGGILHGCVDVAAHRGCDPETLRRSLPSWACMETVAGRSGVELPETGAESKRTKRRGDRALEEVQVAAYKKRCANLAPIWPFWMKAVSCSSPMFAKRGHHGDTLPCSGIATGTTAFRPFRPSLSRQCASDSDCTFTFILTTSHPLKSLSSCAPCFDIYRATSCCCGMAAPSIGSPPLRTSFAHIPVCTRSDFPPTPRNSIRMNSFGHRPSVNSPTAHRRAWMILAGAWEKAFAAYAPPNHFWPPAFPLQNCRGHKRIHYLCEPQ